MPRGPAHPELDGTHMSWENHMLVEVAGNNLMRIWSES